MPHRSARSGRLRRAALGAVTCLLLACGGGATHGPDGRVVDGASGPDAAAADALPVDGAVDAAPGDVDAAGVTTDAGAVTCEAAPPAPGATATIGAAGGALVVGPVRVDVPAGALAIDTTLTLAPITQALPASSRARSAVWELGPPSVAFAIPATLRVDLGQAPPMPDDVALIAGDGTTWAAIATTRSGSGYTAAIGGATRAFVGRVSAAPTPAASSACVAQAIAPPIATDPIKDGVLFTNTTGGDLYHVVQARDEADGLALTATYLADGAWNVMTRRLATDARADAAISVTGNTLYSIFGGHVAWAGGATRVVAYDSNQLGGSEVWVRAIDASGATTLGPVRVSMDSAYSERPQVAQLATGELLVVWDRIDPVTAKRGLAAAALTADLDVIQRFDVVAPLGASPTSNRVPTGHALVTDGAVFGLAWAWADGLGHGGVRYQAFGPTGCPRTAVIEVADALISPVTVAAIPARDGSALLTIGANAAATQHRAIALATGVLGATRVHDLMLRQAATAAAGDGYLLAGAVSGSIEVVRLGAELDRLDAPRVVDNVSGISAPVSIAAHARTGDRLAAITWTSTATGMVTGRVAAVACP